MTTSPFLWQHPRNERNDHALTSEFAASHPLDTTTPFRNWLAELKTRPKYAKPWPEYLAAHTKAPSKRGPKAKDILRDNTISNFTTPIPGKADAAAQFRIKGSAA